MLSEAEIKFIADEVLSIQGNPEDAKVLLDGLPPEAIEEVEEMIDDLWEAHRERYAK